MTSWCKLQLPCCKFGEMGPCVAQHNHFLVILPLTYLPHLCKHTNLLTLACAVARFPFSLRLCRGKSSSEHKKMVNVCTLLNCRSKITLHWIALNFTDCPCAIVGHSSWGSLHFNCYVVYYKSNRDFQRFTFSLTQRVFEKISFKVLGIFAQICIS